jgi:antitoxin component YwqK of YwqJK toxin-antitoxin module
MNQESQLPRLSRVDFFRFKEDEFVSALAQAIRRHLDQEFSANLSANHEALLAWSQMSMDVPNGGFTQFFFNHRGGRGVAELATLLDANSLPKAANVLHDALVVYREHQAEFTVTNPWDGLFGSIKEFDKVDIAFMNILLRCNRTLEQWIRSHITELANDESGLPIDPQFSGAVEIKYPNGTVSAYLEVKKGKPHGAYREFFDDGTVRKVVFYKSGKVTGDFWPDGKPKRRQFTRGSLTIIEWYYPSGQLQKRYVKDKSGYAVEPIRLFHENGQLAEEVNTVRREKCGPWLRYFEDGSPKLKAEYASDRQLIVHDAWNDARTQVVKDGTGVFHDDGISIDWPYDVFFRYNWQHDIVLKEGKPHGKKTTYHDGVLWSVSYYVNGAQDGESITYWENGRVRSVTKFAQGKEGKTKSYPKYDRPLPAVLLSVEANEKLYTAWDHIKVDEYPRVLNLDEIQKLLVIPDFLQEVHERNVAKALKSDYEDWNTFRDGIAYFLVVNEAGEVISANANGSGVYSGGNWDTYPHLLRRLRFTPGRIRGRAIECRVLARVDHTFAESSPR